MFDADVGIIGGGPIGIETHWALKNAGVSVAHLEAGAIGATMGWWAPGTKYFSSPERIEICGVPLVTAGQDKATREEYMAYLRQVVGVFGLPVRTHTRVVDVRPIEGGFELVTEASVHGVGGPAELERDERGARGGPRETRRVRKLVLAIGNMHRPRMLGVPGEGLAHVSHFLGDPQEWYGQRVLVVGGKNSAVEAAIRLYRAGARVTISYRGRHFDRERIKYWLLPEIEWLIRKGRVGFAPCTVPVEVRAGSVVLERVDPGACPSGADLSDVHERQQEHPPVPETGGEAVFGLETSGLAAGERAEVAADGVLLLTGYVQDQGLFERLGVEREGSERRPTVNPRTMETSVPGVYVAGTAAGGTQSRATVFIETSHVHAHRIAAAVTGREAGQESPRYGAMEES